MRIDTKELDTPPFIQHPAYQHLRKAVSEHVAPLVVVVGSGLSHSHGYPNWKELRTTLETALRKKRNAELDADPRYSSAEIDETLGLDDYWDFFKAAKSCLTRPTYNQIIRDNLGASATHSSRDTHSGLHDLMKLRPKGVVTLNLDPLAGNVFSELTPGSMVIPIYGFEMNRRWNLITDEKRFLVYLHGHISSPDTWVLGRDELDALIAQPAHDLFLSSLFANNIVLFIGISADDIAVSAPLMRLKNSGIDVNRVFWFTSRTDAATREWAAASSVQTIPYSASTDEAHATALRALVDDIVEFRSSDTKILPPSTEAPSNDTSTVEKILPDELANRKPEYIRQFLAQYVAQELALVGEDQKYDRFAELVSEYDYPIQTRSFYRSAKDGNRRFFGCDLTFPPLGMGNFGTVYHGHGINSTDVAVKIMHSHILQTPEMIGGFRRGSRSMRILADKNISGVAHLIDTFEMPPTIVMRFVEGNSLEELFAIGGNIPWITKINIINRAATIVNSCHSTEEIVLHRDLKPSNIMVSGLDYTTYDFDNVTILDFDMSWHKGSREKDVVFESRDDFGYLAPEQTDPSIIESSRSTKVDSFGLGMTLLALFSGKHPIPNMSLSSDFSKNVYSAAKRDYNLEWRCLPRRVARLIVDSTTHNQADRLPFSALAFRLHKVFDAATRRSGVFSNDLICEELLARLSEDREYKWDDITDRGRFELIGGVSIELSVDEVTLGTRIRISYQDAGAKQYQRRNELIGNSKSALEKSCRDNGYRIESINIYHGAIESSILIEKPPILDNVEFIKKSLMPSINFLRQIE